MTGGAWKDTNVPAGAKRNKAKKQPLLISTTEHATSRQTEDERFQTEVELADLKIKLRRWNFARSWKIAASSPLADDDSTPLSPRTRRPSRKDAKEAATRPQGRAPLFTDDQVGRKDRSQRDALPSCHRGNITNAQPNSPLDRQMIGQYLERCVAAAESQLAGAGNKSQKKGAVREIERLVEKVMATQLKSGY